MAYKFPEFSQKCHDQFLRGNTAKNAHFFQHFRGEIWPFSRHFSSRNDATRVLSWNPAKNTQFFQSLWGEIWPFSRHFSSRNYATRVLSWNPAEKAHFFQSFRGEIWPKKHRFHFTFLWGTMPQSISRVFRRYLAEMNCFSTNFSHICLLYHRISLNSIFTMEIWKHQKSIL